MTDEQQDEWAWWRNAVAGNRAPLPGDEPQSGYYRGKSKNKQTGQVTFYAFAYWRDSNDGRLRCHRDGRDYDEQRALENWPFVSMHPISHETYLSVVRDGGKWPDESAAVHRSNQAPDDNSFEAFQAKIEDLVREAEQLIAKGSATTQEEADQAADLASRLSGLGKEGPDLQKADPDLTPELQEAATRARNLSMRWLPLIGKTAIYKQIKALVITPFLNKKDEAERRVREAAVKAGEPPPAQPRMSTTKAGTRGKAVALRTVKHVAIEDRAAVLAYFADGQQMTEFLQTAAERAVRAGVTVPGIKITETKVAA